jgi:hypothetical protein
MALGARVHGGFGSFIPVGIRIGLNALRRLGAKPREVTVVYYDSDKAEKAPSSTLAGITIRHKQSGQTVKYSVADSWLPRLAEWNRTLDTRGRYDQVMKAEGLYDVMSLN